MAHTESHGQVHGQRLNHETTDVSLKGITRLAILSLAIIAAVMLLMFGAWAFFVNRAQVAEGPVPPLLDRNMGSRVPPMPRLQTVPIGDLQRYRQVQNERLRSYGWVDRAAGVAHIPIERAMDLMAERADSIANPEAAPAAAAQTAPAEGGASKPGADSPTPPPKPSEPAKKPAHE
jgi:hypothetical protein